MSSDDLSAFAQVDEIAEEFAARYRRGERPSVKEYEDRYPQLAEYLRDLLPAMVQLERVKTDLSQIREPAPVEQLSGTPRLHDFRILREVGRGGMGIVYEAEQISLGRRVAVKILNQSAWRNEDRRRRFAREAKAAARLHHTNIVPVFGVGEENNCPFYVMQFIQGRGLDEVIEELIRQQSSSGQSPAPPPASVSEHSVERLADSLLHTGFARQKLALSDEGAPDSLQIPDDATVVTNRDSETPLPAAESVIVSTSSSPSLLSVDASHSDTSRLSRNSYWHRVAEVGVQVADALDYAHKAGVLHRDIKPSNLLLDLVGTVWVTDFGLAKTNDQEALTQTGDILGTLRYLAPEAFAGHADERSDLYSLGLTLYELLALRPAFGDRDRSSLIKRVTTSDIRRIDVVNPAIPRDLATIVMKAIDREPRGRYQTAADLQADLQRFLNDEPILARRSTIAEIVYRATRRNPGVAAALSVIMVLLVAVVAGLFVAVEFYRTTAQQQTNLVNEKETQRTKAEQASQAAKRAEASAIRSRRQTESTLYDLYTAMGLHSTRPGSPTQGAIWFAEAARIATDDPEAAAVARLRVQNWTQPTPRTIRAWLNPARRPCLVSFNPYGDRILIVSPNESLSVWNLETDQFHEFHEPHKPRICAAWSPDTTGLAVGGADGSLEIFDATTLQSISRIPVFSGPVSCVAFTPDSRWLAVAGDGVRIFDCEKRKLHDSTLAHPAHVIYAAFGESARQLITLAEDHQTRLFRFSNGTPAAEPHVTQTHTWQQFPTSIFCSFPEFINHDYLFVTRLKEGPVSVWNSETGELLKTFEATEFVQFGAPDIHRDQHLLTHANRPEGAEQVDVLTGTSTPTNFSHSNFISSTSFRPDLSRVATGSLDRTVKIWDYATGRIIDNPLQHQDELSYVRFSLDGQRLLTLQHDGLLRVWDVSSPLRTRSLQQVACWGEMSADRKYYVPAGNPWGLGLNTLHVYDVATSAPSGVSLTFHAHTFAATLSTDASLVAAATTVPGTPIGDSEQKTLRELPGLIQFRLTRDGSVPRPPLKMPTTPVGVSFSPDNKQLAVICVGGQVRLFDTRTYEVLQEYQHDSHFTPQFITGRLIAFHPQGNMFVTWMGGMVNLWETTTNTPKIRFADNVQNVHDARFSPDGRWLVICSSDKYARVYDTQTGKPAAAPLLHPDWVFHCCFNSDGTRLATACRDHMVRYWDWRQGRLAASGMRHDDEAFGVTLTRDDRWLLSTGRDGTLRIWDTRSGLPTSLPIKLGGNAYRVFLNADEHHAVLASSTNDLKFCSVESFLTPPETLTVETLRLAAEVRAGQSLLNNTPDNLATLDWWNRWKQLSASQGLIPLPEAPIPSIHSLHTWKLLRDYRDRGQLAEAGRLFYDLIQESGPQLVSMLVTRQDSWSDVFLEAVTQNPHDIPCLNLAMDYETNSGHWREAAVLFQKYTEQRPADFRKWFLLATLQMEIGDREGYHRTCHKLLDYFADKISAVPDFCEQLSKSCLLLPDAELEFPRVFALAQRAQELAGPDSTNFWIMINLAVAHYRAGDLDAAETHLQRFMRSSGVDFVPMHAQALALQALIQHARHKDQEARESLELARKRLREKYPDPKSGRPFDINWSEWLRGGISVREAEQALQNSADKSEVPATDKQ